MATKRSSLVELLQCPICLEKLFQPKVLSCQHRFCKKCLDDLCRDRETLECPKCRKKHEIPLDGVDGFADDIMSNDLLSLPTEEEFCSDCRLEFVTETCDHCQLKVCKQCLVLHAKLCTELDISLRNLREHVEVKRENISEEAKTKIVADALEIDNEMDKMKREFEIVFEKLRKRRDHLENLMTIIKDMHFDVANVSEGEENLSFLSERLKSCRKIDELEGLKKRVADCKAIAECITSSDDDKFEFVNENVKKDWYKSLKIKIGGRDILIKGNYSQGAREGGRENFTLEAASEEGFRFRPAIDRNASTETTTYQVDAAVEVSDLYQLPINLQYKNAAFTVLKTQNLPSPNGCAYDKRTDTVYVADGNNHRVMKYDVDGRDAGTGKPFLEKVASPVDVCICPTGQFVYVVSHVALRKYTKQGQLVREIKSFHDMDFEHCACICAYGPYIVLLECEGRYLLFYNSSCDLVNHMALEERIKSPIAMAVNATKDEILITDADTGYIHVVNGLRTGLSYRERFGELAKDDIDGITVDGDGTVCVARYCSNRIDVYDAGRRLTATLGKGRLKGPTSMSLIRRFETDCRLLVTDSGNNRIVVFRLGG